MKRILLLAMLLAGCGLFTEEVSAQAVLGRHAITSGFHDAGDAQGIDLDGTIGQSITGTISIPDQYLTQGFQQPDDYTPCPGDVNGDGLVSTVDILDVLGYYGCLADCGDYDTNGDGLVGAPDLLFILGYYGQICE